MHEDQDSFNDSSLFEEECNLTSTLQLPTRMSWGSAAIICTCTLLILATIVGNFFICVAVVIVRKLQTPSNLLFVSLAVSDLLVAILVMPLAVLYEVTGAWTLGRLSCDLWTSLDVMLCTASILNLCAISVDRYFVITRPMRYAVKRTTVHAIAIVASVWCLSAVISIPPLLGWKADYVDGECILSQDIGNLFPIFHVLISSSFIANYNAHRVREYHSNPQTKLGSSSSVPISPIQLANAFPMPFQSSLSNAFTIQQL